MNKSSKFCLNNKTAGHGFKSAANPFLSAELLRPP